jgi:hypothetical protein
VPGQPASQQADASSASLPSLTQLKRRQCTATTPPPAPQHCPLPAHYHQTCRRHSGQMTPKSLAGCMGSSTRIAQIWPWPAAPA